MSTSLSERAWIEGAWPDYKRIRRYRPGRKIGPLGIEWNPDHFPWPQIHVYQAGSYLNVALTIGPLGPDPVIAFDLKIPRPRTVAR